MSLDITIRMPATPPCIHCGSHGRSGEMLYESDLTYNYGPMIGEAAKCAGVAAPLDAGAIEQPTINVIFGKWRMLDGIDGRAGDYIGKLGAILSELTRTPEKYQAMDPENGWGDYNSLVPELSKMLDVMIANPEAIVKAGR